MINNALKLFHAMYQILDDLYSGEEDLLIFISDANPSFCLDKKSIDPAVFEDFEMLFKQKIGDGISDYEFILYFLEHLDPYYGDIKKYFISIPRDECEKKLASFLKR